MGVVFDPLDEILGNRAKVRLLRALLSTDDDLGVREAARLAQISHVAALRPLDELALAGVLNRKITGRQHRYRPNEEYSLLPALKALFEEERLRLARIFDAIKKVIKAQPGVEGAYLIGSAVRGDDRPGSDLDLLVVVSDQRRADALTESITADAVWLRYQYGFMISPVVVSRKRLSIMRQKRDAFVLNALRDARTLVGPPLKELLDGAQ